MFIYSYWRNQIPHKIQLLYNIDKIIQRMFSSVKILIAIYLVLQRVSSWCEYSRFKENQTISCVDYSEDGIYLATTTATHVTVWKASTKQLYKTFPITNAKCAKFSKDIPTSRIAISAADRIYIYSLTSPFAQIITNFDPGAGSGFVAIQFETGTAKLLVCGNNNRVFIWTVSSTPAVQSTNFVVSQLLTCTFGATGRIAVGRSNNKLDYMNTAGSGSVLQSQNVDECLEIAMKPGNTAYIAACQDSDSGVIASIYGGDSVLINGAGDFYTASYAPDSNHMAFGGERDTLYILNATSSNNTIIEKFIAKDDIIDSDFTPDSNYLIIGCKDGAIYEYARYCMKCDPGYYWNSGNKLCDQCWPSLQGCGLCSDSITCLQCVQGYIIDTATSKCKDCKVNLAGCGSCNTANNCSYCLPGYYLDKSLANYDCKRCQAVMIGCYICNSSTVCLECESDYFLDSGTNKCVTCSESQDHCIKCYTQTYCFQCQIGFYVSSFDCVACPTNCYACQSNINCTACTQGYRPVTSGGSTLCSRCPNGCLACNSAGACSDCYDQRYLTASGNCDLCSLPCSTCSSTATTCLSCISGYYFTIGTGCTICTYPCLTCNISTTCYSCAPLYYLDTSTNTCQLCPNTYGNCSSCTNTTCLVCNMGYYLQPGTPNTCQNCLIDMHGCISCNTSTNCLVCAAGYYRVGASLGNDSCQICSLGCAACYDAIKCTNCHNGFYLNTATDTCNFCDNQCVRCTTINNCLECQTGYYISGTTCLSCKNIDSNCLSCVYDLAISAMKCLSCHIGYYYNTGNSQCEQCDKNCTVCSGTSSICTSCEIGFYLQTSTDDCLSCHQNCSDCVTQTQCTSCNAGYYLTAAKACEHCSIINCATCNITNNQCLSCRVGYYLNSTSSPSVCSNCLSGMNHCQICVSEIQCQLCSYGYALATNRRSCSECSDIEGCKHCLSLASCENCQIGYYIKIIMGNKICTKCPLGCKQCDGSGVCQQCISGYTFTAGNNCQLCRQLLRGCLLCEDDQVCTQCQSGYYLNQITNQCELCQTSIFACQYCDSDEKCTHCFDGFYLNLTSQKCQACDDSLYGCELCNSSTVCLSCQFGLYVQSNMCYICSANLPNCLYCSDASTCKSCSSGSFLDGVVCVVCEAHIVGCLLCSSANLCLQCQGGYFLDSGSNLCMPCAQQGCQVCHQADPLKCLQCNSKYYLNSTQENCILCRTQISGCMQCTNSTRCRNCDPGYFIDPNNYQCQLCSSVLYGCGRCSSDSVCLQCKASYYISSTDNQCHQCKLQMPGCSYCIVDTACQACWHGYYLSIIDSLCYSCNTVDGCVSCLNETHCLYCDPEYFLDSTDNMCYPCSVMAGCYACMSNVTCSICQGGFVRNDKQLCSKMRVQASKEITDLKFITQYINQTTLKHTLYAKSMTYNQVDINSISWTDKAKILLQDQTYEQIKLTINKVEWGPTSNSLNFFTNNPLKIEKKPYQIVKARRLLTLDGSVLDKYKINLDMSQETMNIILPDFYLDQDLVMDYDIKSPQFISSYITYNTNSFIDIRYSIFGIGITGILLIKYIIKSMCTVKGSYEMGSIMPHVFAHKIPAIVIYPTFIEFVSYCYGFMTPDFPWVNWYFGDIFGQQADKVPGGYGLLYVNLNFGCTYFLAFIIVIFVSLLLLAYYKGRENEQFKDRYPLGIVVGNFFLFGFVFAGVTSLVGALENISSDVTINSIFYMIGIAFYSFILGISIYFICKSRHNFYILRTVIKATLLGFAIFSPIYIFSAAMITDVLCIIIQYFIGHRFHSKYPKIWFLKNILLNISLATIIFYPQIMLSILLTSGIIVIVVILDCITHIKQYRDNSQLQKLQNCEQSSSNDVSENNIWNINFEKNTKEKEDEEFGEVQDFDGMKTTFQKTISPSRHQMIPRRNKFKKNRGQKKSNILNITELSNSKQDQAEEYEIQMDNAFVAEKYLSKA